MSSFLKFSIILHQKKSFKLNLSYHCIIILYKILADERNLENIIHFELETKIKLEEESKVNLLGNKRSSYSDSYLEKKNTTKR